MKANASYPKCKHLQMWTTNGRFEELVRFETVIKTFNLCRLSSERDLALALFLLGIRFARPDLGLTKYESGHLRGLSLSSILPPP
jgi:hypothetical protein